jgi:hypothetical protein
MYSLNQVNKLVSCGRDPARSLPLWRGFLLIPLILVCFALSPNAQAAPAPQTPDPGSVLGTFNTADGHNALHSATAASVANSAFGAFSLFALTTGQFNTSCGALALDLNNADFNTAVGAAALLFNNKGTGADTGTRNTAVGTAALENNRISGGTNDGDGSFNSAVGAFSLFNNIDGFSNNAVGDSALFANIHGAFNTAVGDLALQQNDADGSATADFNTAVGAEALLGPSPNPMVGNSNNAVGAQALTANAAGGFNQAFGVLALGSNLDGAANVAVGDTALGANAHGSFNTIIGDQAGATLEGDDNIYIGATSGDGVTSESGTIRIGDPAFVVACFVAGITGVGVSGDTVVVDGNGQLGTAAAGSPLSLKEVLKQRQVVQQLKATAEKQAARIALQENQIQTLTAALKQQAEQIQKVSAQLEMIRPAPRVVNNQ